jgi:GLPGLI family protein
MKTTVLTFAVLLSGLIARGQDANPVSLKSGKIIYEEKVKIEIKLEGDAAAYANMLPKERKTEKVLTFSEDATLYEDNKTVEEDMEMAQEEGMKIRMVVSGENKIYTDLKNQKVLEQRDFMNRMFLVEKPMPEMNWKVTGNQKVILGYPCMEAYKTDTAGVRTTVWFAPSLSVRSGPSGICSLPGMVLEADINNGSRLYTAKSIEPVAPKDLKLQRPKEGKSVSEKEFSEIVAAKMKEMGIENGQPGQNVQMHIMIKK